MNTNVTAKYIEAEGTSMMTFPVSFELEGYASGKRRNDVKVGMVEPERLQLWDLASDEGRFHGGDETAPKPLALFTAGVVTCFMTQLRTFARQCGVSVTGLKTNAKFEWVAKRSGKNDPYEAHPNRFTLDIEFETDSPLEAQKRLVRTAARGCFAEQILSVDLIHRLRHEGEWVTCEVD
ncbi:OsmC family protein [Trinickia mobilis]|uniref:OsmC family protein n=1 Tax=Trinickia mobilis TaxID=2816356 RepID=UPI001A8E9D65|nr:OsmC family protein [Trinickia mobilis]